MTMSTNDKPGFNFFPSRGRGRGRGRGMNMSKVFNAAPQTFNSSFVYLISGRIGNADCHFMMICRCTDATSDPNTGFHTVAF